MSAVGEEKNSLFKEDHPGRESLFRVYCFPDIGVAHPLKNGGPSRESGVFQRVPLVQEPTPCPPVREIPPPSPPCSIAPQVVPQEIEDRGFRKGYHQGEKVGRELGRKDVEPLIKRFEEALLEIEKFKEHLTHALEKETVDLALAVAKKVVCHEITHNTETIVHVVKEVLRRVIDDQKVKIRLHPSEVRLIDASRPQFADIVKKVDGIVLEPDEAITPGGCLVETNFGEIDARIDKQFESIQDAFTLEQQLQEREE